jgi:hypothetical protein
MLNVTGLLFLRGNSAIATRVGTGGIKTQISPAVVLLLQKRRMFSGVPALLQ